MTKRGGVSRYIDKNRELWEVGKFVEDALLLPRELTPQRDLWKAVHKKDIDTVQRLLKVAPSHIFTHMNMYDLTQHSTRRPYSRDYWKQIWEDMSDLDFYWLIRGFTNVVTVAAELGHHDILDLIITAHPSSIDNFINVCFYKKYVLRNMCFIYLHYHNLLLLYVVSDNTAHESCYT